MTSIEQNRPKFVKYLKIIVDVCNRFFYLLKVPTIIQCLSINQLIYSSMLYPRIVLSFYKI